MNYHIFCLVNLTNLFPAHVSSWSDSAGGCTHGSVVLATQGGRELFNLSFTVSICRTITLAYPEDLVVKLLPLSEASEMG